MFWQCFVPNPLIWTCTFMWLFLLPHKPFIPGQPKIMSIKVHQQRRYKFKIIQIPKDTTLRSCFFEWFVICLGCDSKFCVLFLRCSAKCFFFKTCLKDDGVIFTCLDMSWHVLTCLDNLRSLCSGLCSWFMLTFTCLYPWMGSRKTDTQSQKPKRFANLPRPLLSF